MVACGSRSSGGEQVQAAGLRALHVGRRRRRQDLPAAGRPSGSTVGTGTAAPPTPRRARRRSPGPPSDERPHDQLVARGDRRASRRRSPPPPRRRVSVPANLSGQTGPACRQSVRSHLPDADRATARAVGRSRGDRPGLNLANRHRAAAARPGHRPRLRARRRLPGRSARAERPRPGRARAAAAKAALGDRVFVLGHHYQRDEVIQFADVTGDSFKLARDAAARPDAEFIVFCGVHFMAESADILTSADAAGDPARPGRRLLDGRHGRRSPRSRRPGTCWTELGVADVDRPGDVHELLRRHQGLRRPPRRRGVHLVERQAGAGLGVRARPAGAVPARPAPGPQHRGAGDGPRRSTTACSTTRTSRRRPDRRRSCARRR